MADHSGRPSAYSSHVLSAWGVLLAVCAAIPAGLGLHNLRIYVNVDLASSRTVAVALLTLAVPCIMGALVCLRAAARARRGLLDGRLLRRLSRRLFLCGWCCALVALVTLVLSSTVGGYAYDQTGLIAVAALMPSALLLTFGRSSRRTAGGVEQAAAR